jgi:hypothetical protein
MIPPKLASAKTWFSSPSGFMSEYRYQYKDRSQVLVNQVVKYNGDKWYRINKGLSGKKGEPDNPMVQLFHIKNKHCTKVHVNELGVVCRNQKMINGCCDQHQYKAPKNSASTPSTTASVPVLNEPVEFSPQDELDESDADPMIKQLISDFRELGHNDQKSVLSLVHSKLAISITEVKQPITILRGRRSETYKAPNMSIAGNKTYDFRA